MGAVDEALELGAARLAAVRRIERDDPPVAGEPPDHAELVDDRLGAAREVEGAEARLGRVDHLEPLADAERRDPLDAGEVEQDLPSSSRASAAPLNASVMRPASRTTRTSPTMRRSNARLSRRPAAPAGGTLRVGAARCAQAAGGGRSTVVGLCPDETGPEAGSAMCGRDRPAAVRRRRPTVGRGSSPSTRRGQRRRPGRRARRRRRRVEGGVGREGRVRRDLELLELRHPAGRLRDDARRHGRRALRGARPFAPSGLRS